MLKKEKKSAVGEITEQLVISFFFISIFILLVNFLFMEKINTYLNIINMVSIEEKEIKYPEVRFDSVSKKLINYPLWGTEFGTIEIPSVNIKQPIYQGDTLDILKYGVGHYSGSMFFGEGGSIILAGHNNKGFLYHLPEVKIDDTIEVKTTYGTFTYKIYDTKIIHHSNNDAFPYYKDQEVLMIYTCYPVNTIGHKKNRFVVYAKKVGETYEK